MLEKYPKKKRLLIKEEKLRMKERSHRPNHFVDAYQHSTQESNTKLV